MGVGPGHPEGRGGWHLLSLGIRHPPPQGPGGTCPLLSVAAPLPPLPGQCKSRLRAESRWAGSLEEEWSRVTMATGKAGTLWPSHYTASHREAVSLSPLALHFCSPCSSLSRCPHPAHVSLCLESSLPSLSHRNPSPNSTTSWATSSLDLRLGSRCKSSLLH